MTWETQLRLKRKPRLRLKKPLSQADKVIAKGFASIKKKKIKGLR
jgi:hypothetical protein